MAERSGWGRPDGRAAARERLASNPFYVLGLRPDCTRAEVEREGQKLIAMLELELRDAAEYRSPLGVHRRTTEQVRAAMAELRDPNRRLLHELWATLEPEAGEDQRDADAPAPGEADLAGFPALRMLGFGEWKRR